LLLIQACVAAMVRIEHMDFLLPMKIGEVAELTAEIVYTSTHSLLVEIKVHAENIITGNVIDGPTGCLIDCCTQFALCMESSVSFKKL